MFMGVMATAKFGKKCGITKFSAKKNLSHATYYTLIMRCLQNAVKKKSITAIFCSINYGKTAHFRVKKGR